MANHPVNDTATERYTVPGLQRGLQLLAQFNQHTRELNGAELARRLALPRASVFRLLQTLEQMGFVERVGESSNYRLGIAVLRLGFEYLASMDLAERGNPVLNALSATSGLSAHLVVRDGTEVVFVAKSAGNSGLLSAIQVGARLPAHATVLGRVLLGQITQPALELLYAQTPLTAFTAQTPTTLAALQTKIDDAAAQGFAVSHGGYESGISTVAAPVFDENQQITAAVSLTVPASRIDAARLPALIKLVCEAAARLSRGRAHPGGAKAVLPRFSRANPESEFA